MFVDRTRASRFYPPMPPPLPGGNARRRAPGRVPPGLRRHAFYRKLERDVAAPLFVSSRRASWLAAAQTAVAAALAALLATGPGALPRLCRRCRQVTRAPTSSRAHNWLRCVRRSVRRGAGRGDVRDEPVTRST